MSRSKSVILIIIKITKINKKLKARFTNIQVFVLYNMYLTMHKLFVQN